ncbi:hypothetical protein BpHYR1_014995 [Brachionus plicatilis]|uniref:Uncharacterized protein n=1 Tax=Brachionus plicatilis TaxID=10195 RepID=A0A3M7QXH1_BRAPC|nr:hypothetical protein BpHYR1_014995 [Brachionus plicatilis]
MAKDWNSLTQNVMNRFLEWQEVKTFKALHRIRLNALVKKLIPTFSQKLDITSIIKIARDFILI